MIEPRCLRFERYGPLNRSPTTAFLHTVPSFLEAMAG